METWDLMKLLIPDGKVDEIAKFSRLNKSILYMERRKSGDDLTDTGTRNTIDRLDSFCEWNLDRNPEVVKMVGERYTRMYEHHTEPLEEVTVCDLLAQLGLVSKEVGEAMAKIGAQATKTECTVETDQAVAALQKALRMLLKLKEQQC